MYFTKALNILFKICFIYFYRCRVTKFTGLLSTLSCLPETTVDLKVAFTNTDHAKKLLEEMKDLVKTNDITYIGKQMTWYCMKHIKTLTSVVY